MKFQRVRSGLYLSDRQVRGFRSGLGVGGIAVSRKTVAAGSPGGGTTPTITKVSPLHGLSGDEITVTGTNFLAGSMTATVQGLSATVVAVDSATVMRVTAPAGSAGVADVVVIRTGVQSQPLTAGFLYRPTGYTTIVNDACDDKLFTSPAHDSSESIAWFTFNTADSKVVNGSDANEPMSPSSALDCINYIGYAVNGAVDGPTYRISFAAARSEVFAVVPVKVNAGWQYPGSGITKLGFVNTSENPAVGNEVIFAMLRTSSPANFGMFCQAPVNSGSGFGGYEAENVEAVSLTDGDWAVLAFQLIKSTGGGSNGTMRWWVWKQSDNRWRESGNHTDIKYKTTGDAAFEQFMMQEVFGGGTEPGKSQTDHLYYGHAYVATKV